MKKKISKGITSRFILSLINFFVPFLSYDAGIRNADMKKKRLMKYD